MRAGALPSSNRPPQTRAAQSAFSGDWGLGHRPRGDGGREGFEAARIDACGAATSVGASFSRTGANLVEGRLLFRPRAAETDASKVKTKHRRSGSIVARGTCSASSKIRSGFQSSQGNAILLASTRSGLTACTDAALSIIWRTTSGRRSPCGTGGETSETGAPHCVARAGGLRATRFSSQRR